MKRKEKVELLLEEHKRIWRFFKDRCEADPCSAIAQAAGACKAAGYMAICEETLLSITPKDRLPANARAVLVSYGESRLGFDCSIFSQMILTAKKDAAHDILAIFAKDADHE